MSEFFFAQEGFEIAGFEMLKGLDGISTHESSVWVRIFENTQHIPDLAEQVQARLADAASPLKYGSLQATNRVLGNIISRRSETA